MGEVDPNDSPAIHTVATESLNTLVEQVGRLTEVSAAAPQPVKPPQIVSRSGGEWVDARDAITAWRARAKVLQESLHVLRLLDEITERTDPVLVSVAAANAEAEAVGNELKRLREDLSQARAEKAQNELSSQFKSLAQREHWTSWSFRGITLVLAGIAIVVAIKVPTEAEWPRIASHLAIALVLGGISAYTARLASAHRSTGDWADSVRIQLNTFQDFLGVIDDATARTRVYEEFGRRVLGAPPAFSGSDEESGAMPVAQLVQLASLMADARKG